MTVEVMVPSTDKLVVGGFLLFTNGHGCMKITSITNTAQGKEIQAETGEEQIFSGIITPKAETMRMESNIPLPGPDPWITARCAM